LVERHGPLPEGRVVRILEQICGSLAEAHGIGLIHRDIKPANIILSHRGGVADLVKVLDFGLVKSLGAEHEANVTAANALTGTPLYLSPEAIDKPDTIDTRSDIYAIGAVGYFLLTGTPVFSGKSIVEICMHHVRTPPEPPSKRLGRPVSPQLEAVIMSCLAKDRADRPASARVIQEMLVGCALAESWSRDAAEAWWQQSHKATIVAPVASTGVAEAGNTVAYPSLKEVGNETAPGKM
jgi:serine/threonine protein kinase